MVAFASDYTGGHGGDALSLPKRSCSLAFSISHRRQLSSTGARTNVRLLSADRIQRLSGKRVCGLGPQRRCTGRACRSAEAVEGSDVRRSKNELARTGQNVKSAKAVSVTLMDCAARTIGPVKDLKEGDAGARRKAGTRF
jgi:hypothetical protein